MSAFLLSVAGFIAFLVAAAFGFTAAVVVCAPKGPRPTPPLDDHMRVAVEDTSATPLYDALAIEVFQQQLDDRIHDALMGWGHDEGGAA